MTSATATFDFAKHQLLLGAVVAACAGTAQAHTSGRSEGMRDFAHQSRAGSAARLRTTSDALGEVFYITEAEADSLPLDRARATTDREHAIAEIRRWRNLQTNWDSEGAAAPVLGSLLDASDFACALESRHLTPEPMLHTSGRAGLYWRTADLYADLEFLGGGRIAFYYEKNGSSGTDRLKGVVHFDGTNLPGVLEPLLRA